MRCPACKADAARVVETRDATDAGDQPALRRRRACTACRHAFTTFELVVGDAESRGGKTGPRRALMLTVASLAAFRELAALIGAALADDPNRE